MCQDPGKIHVKTCPTEPREKGDKQATCVQSCSVDCTHHFSVKHLPSDAHTGRAYEEYLGIPFASPPLGEQRWRRADPPRAWNGTRDATAYDAHCTSILAQFYGLVGWDVNVSEDCLYLNVVVPGSVDSIE